MPVRERDALTAIRDCIAEDLGCIDRIRAARYLPDFESAQLNGVREHLEQYRGRLVTLLLEQPPGA
jgi:hypothetical protein